MAALDVVVTRREIAERPLVDIAVATSCSPRGAP
jgi:hypothetical protein